MTFNFIKIAYENKTLRPAFSHSKYLMRNVCWYVYSKYHRCICRKFIIFKSLVKIILLNIK